MMRDPSHKTCAIYRCEFSAQIQFYFSLSFFLFTFISHAMQRNNIQYPHAQKTQKITSISAVLFFLENIKLQFVAASLLSHNSGRDVMLNRESILKKSN